MRLLERPVKRDIKSTRMEQYGLELSGPDRPLMGCCEHGEEPLSSTKCGIFLTT
jgi:hypothetical protein